MSRKRTLLTGILLVLLIFTAWSVVAAQDEPDARPYLGVSFDAESQELLIVSVAPGSPAARAGLRQGDVVTAIDGEAVTTANIVQVILSYSVGDTITLTVERDDDELEIELTLAARPEDTAAPVPPAARPFLGVRLEEDSVEVLVAEVLEGTAAETAGILAGDLIVGVDDTEITTIDQLIAVIRAYSPGDTITVAVERDGEILEFEATLGEAPPTVPVIVGIGGDEIAYLPDEAVWEVLFLADGSPLADFGLQPGDRITEINGISYSPANLRDLLTDVSPTETATFTVERDGDTLEIEVPGSAVLSLLTTAPIMVEPQVVPPREFRAPPFDSGLPTPANRARLGVLYQTLDEQTAAGLGLDVSEGALILEIEPGSPADAAGLQADDIVTAVDGDAVDFRRTLAYRLQPYEPGDVITLTVLRGGQSLEIAVTLGHFPDRAELPFTMRSPLFRFSIPGLPGLDGLPLPAPAAPSITPRGEL
jgi:S1-C subfamily serine protease